MIFQPFWDIASFRELASGVPLKPWITFHMSGPSELDIASGSRFFQLSDLVSLIALVASWQVSIHSWQFYGSFDRGDYGCGSWLGHVD